MGIIESLGLAFFTLMSGLEDPHPGGTANLKPDWVVEKAWEAQEGNFILEARSTKIVEFCKENQKGFIKFPGLLNAHEMRLDGKLIYSKGDPTFNEVETFYGLPVLKCSTLQAGTELHWKVIAGGACYATVAYAPMRYTQTPLHNFFGEIAYIVAFGALLLFGIFSSLIFRGRAPNKTVMAYALACFFFSSYFLACVAGYVGISIPAVTANKWSDISIYMGTFLFIYAIQSIGLSLKRGTMIVYFANLLIGLSIISLSKNLDGEQLGSISIMILTIFLPLFYWIRVTYNMIRTRNNAMSMKLQVLGLGLYSFALINEALMVTVAIPTVPLISLGAVGGLLFIGLGINTKINETYKERDYLRSNLEAEVERQTAEIRNKTSQLQTAMNELKSTQAELVHSAKLASLGTLAAGIAHEINNSLNYVNGALAPLERMITGDPQKADPKKINNLVAIMKEGLQLTFEIIKSLKNYTGLNQAALKDLNLKELVDSVLTILKTKLRDKFETTVEVDEKLKVFGSIVGLNQVLMNLVSNSIDAMPDGGKLTITAQDMDDEWAVLQVTDNGSGIPQEIRDRIFDPFFTTKDVGSGTGLGLHIVKSEVEKQGGRLELTSEPGKGTTFKIFLHKKGNENQMKGAA